MYTQLMTNVSAPIYDFLDKEAKIQKTTKREILEKALELYKEHRKNGA